MKAIIDENNFVKAVGANIAPGNTCIEVSSLPDGFDPFDLIENGCLRYHCDNDGVVTARDAADMEASEDGQENKFSRVREKILDRLALQEVVNHPAVPQGLKDRAQVKLDAVNQELANIIGV